MLAEELHIYIIRCNKKAALMGTFSFFVLLPDNQISLREIVQISPVLGHHGEQLYEVCTVSVVCNLRPGGHVCHVSLSATSADEYSGSQD